MWENYGRILSEYMFMNDFRSKNIIEINGQEILDEIKKNNGQLYLFLDISIILN